MVTAMAVAIAEVIAAVLIVFVAAYKSGISCSI